MTSDNLRIILTLCLAAFMIGCFGRDPDHTPDQFDPPVGMFSDQVGRLVLERKWDKNPVCIRDGHLICTAFYVDPEGDPDLTRINYFVNKYDSPEQAVKRLEEIATERTMDEDVFTWETLPGTGSRLLVRSGFRQLEDGIIGSCSLSYTNESMLVQITSSENCEAPREFLKNLR